jgi:hypothetical protein
VLDGRTTLGRELADWKADLIHNLGGDVSTEQAAVIEPAVRTKLLRESIDVWLLTQPTLGAMRSLRRRIAPLARAGVGHG